MTDETEAVIVVVRLAFSDDDDPRIHQMARDFQNKGYTTEILEGIPEDFG